MTLMLRILNFIFKFNRKNKKSSFIAEEDFVGYEAFPSGYSDKLFKNSSENQKVCGKG